VPVITALPPTYKLFVVEIPPVTLRAPVVELEAAVVLATTRSAVLSIVSKLPECASIVFTFKVDIFYISLFMI
jgi:hypothetical protein